MTSKVLSGTPGAPGVATGRVLRVEHPSEQSPVWATAAQVDVAFDAVAAHLRELGATWRERGAGAPADIMDTTALIADDPDLRSAALAAVATGVSADRAVSEAADLYADMLAALPDPTLAARAADVRLVGRRVVDRLRGHQQSTMDEQVILVAAELGADDLLEAAANVAGGVSRAGGPNAHVAIVARALGVPLVFGIEVPRTADGLPAVVDGATATLTVSPTARQWEAAERAMAAARQRRDALAAQRDLPAVTRDGQAVTLLANVSNAIDVVAGLAAGAEGAGLIRTELPFLAARDWPTQAEHAAALRPVLAALAEHVATVRTLDFAPDKLPPFLAGRDSAHRGLDLMLAAPEAFAAQFRAILEVGAGPGLRIMVPMVTSVDQLRRCRALLATAAAERGVVLPALGAMIELPEAVAAVDEIAAGADFLSIGSNDLTAALLGLDRGDPALTPARAADPVVLRAIAAVVEAGRRHERSVSVCGDAAGDPAVVPLLLAAGCRVLSVAPTALDEVRAAVRDAEPGKIDG